MGLGYELGNEKKEQQITKSQLGALPRRIQYRRVNNDYLGVEEIATSITINTLDGSTLFWDSDIQGNWDDFYWSGDETNDGYLTRGVLSKIICPNNIYVEEFLTEDFKG